MLVNVILDAFLNRRPFDEPARALLRKAEAGELVACLVGTSPTTFDYVAAESLGRDAARLAIGKLLGLCEVLAVDRRTLEAAFALGWPDFEDAAREAAAEAAGVGVIVTRDATGFGRSARRVVDASGLLGGLD